MAAFAGTSGPSPIPPAPNFQLNTSIATLCRGVINTVPITITNTQNTAGSPVMKNVQLGVSSSKTLYVVGNGSVQTINININSSAVANVPIFVSLNASTLTTASISINYIYDTLYTDSEIRNISFGIETCPSVFTVSTAQDVITSGKIENMTLNLTNSGNASLSQVSLQASIPSIDGQVLTTQPVQIKSIAANSHVYTNMSVFVYKNATQSFPLNITASMYNGTRIVQVKQGLILLSSGIINITPSSTTLSPEKPTSGGIFSISLVLTDVGTAGASAVTATAMPPAGFSAFGADPVFVGDMQVDSQTPVTITLLTNASVKSGSYIIPVRINYLNNLRQNLSTMIEVPVIMSKSGSATLGSTGTGSRTVTASQRSGGGAIVIGVLVIIVIALGVLLYKEKKKPHQKK